MTNISLSAEDMKPVVAKAIMDSLSGDKKELLIQEALTYLITAPPKTGYGAAQPSPLQNAFQIAIQDVARGVVAEVLEGEEAQRLLRKTVTDAVMKSLDNHYELSDIIGEAVGEYIRRKTDY